MSSYNTTQMILVMDSAVLPEHIKQTFRLRENLGGPQGPGGWVSDITMLEVLSLGEEIDLKVGGYALVYADDSYHRNKAADVYDQIQSLRPNAQIMWLPVEVDAQQTDTPNIQWLMNANPFNFVGKP